VTFTIDGHDGAFEATIIAIDPNINADTRTLRVKASAPNPNGKLLPGAFAQVRVNLQTFENTILVPTQAIIPELGGKKVYVFKGGIAESREVETGIRKDALIQVLRGIEAGDTVITTGVLQIRAGAPVRLTGIEP
jgi:membrane fusion protein (multidrug efflux system)